MHATAFALGIHEDTGSLTYSSTTHRDVEALAACVRLGANQEQLARYLRSPLQPEQRELLGRLDRCPHRARGRGPARRGRGRKRRPLRRGCVLAGVARGRFRGLGRALSLRRDGGPGAGGRPQPHSRAVGRPGARSVRWRRACAGRVRRRARGGPGGRAGAGAGGGRASRRRAAAAPGRSCRSRCMPSRAEELISAALVECQRLGLSGIQVSDDGHLTGVVAREDLDRAVRHGLSHAPVKGVMSAGVRRDRGRRDARRAARAARDRPRRPARGRGRWAAPVRGQGPDLERPGRRHARGPAARAARARGARAAGAGPRGDRGRARAPRIRSSGSRTCCPRSSLRRRPTRACTWSAARCATCCSASRASTST